MKLFFLLFSIKIDNRTLVPDLDLDLNWVKVLDPDQNSIYLDPLHC